MLIKKPFPSFLIFVLIILIFLMSKKFFLPQQKFTNPLVYSSIDDYAKLNNTLASFTINNTNVSSQSGTKPALPSPSIFPQPSLSPSPSASPSLNPSPSFSPSPSISPQENFSSEQINGFIEEYSSSYGVDANILRHIAICESGFNPSSYNLWYAGLFQFSSSAWKKYRMLMQEDLNADLRFNARESVKTGAYVLSINEAYIWPNCIPE